MYKFKNNFIYYISKIKNETYILDCNTNEITELDSIGTELLRELLDTIDEKRTMEILKLFEGKFDGFFLNRSKKCLLKEILQEHKLRYFLKIVPILLN